MSHSEDVAGLATKRHVNKVLYFNLCVRYVFIYIYCLGHRIHGRIKISSKIVDYYKF